MWRHIVIEGYCFANVEQPSEKRPCRRRAVSSFCLLNGMCPHFSYCDSNEREVAIFVPLRGILWDRIKCITEEGYWKLRWCFWGRWFLEKEQKRFKEYMKTHTAECPAWDEQLRQAKANFPEWLKEAKKHFTEKSGQRSEGER